MKYTQIIVVVAIFEGSLVHSNSIRNIHYHSHVFIHMYYEEGSTINIVEPISDIYAARVHGVAVSHNATHYYGHMTQLLEQLRMEHITATDIVDIIECDEGITEDIGMSTVVGHVCPFHRC